MARGRVVYHVAPNAGGDQWLISRENDETFRAYYRTKEEAVEAAKERARGQEPSQVTVHRRDGDIEYESMYGGDPRGAPS